MSSLELVAARAAPMPKRSALRRLGRRRAAARPSSVISASVARRSLSWGTRATSPSASSLSTMFVTLRAVDLQALADLAQRQRAACA